uniref:Uncharacterized protein n=1 Tax=Eutreptiella gymnastica TaxID=73025 RepID=A0A7S1NRS2_9EUGL
MSIHSSLGLPYAYHLESNSGGPVHTSRQAAKFRNAHQPGLSCGIEICVHIASSAPAPCVHSAPHYFKHTIYPDSEPSSIIRQMVAYNTQFIPSSLQKFLAEEDMNYSTIAFNFYGW